MTTHMKPIDDRFYTFLIATNCYRNHHTKFEIDGTFLQAQINYFSVADERSINNDRPIYRTPTWRQFGICEKPNICQTNLNKYLNKIIEFEISTKGFQLNFYLQILQLTLNLFFTFCIFKSKTLGLCVISHMADRSITVICAAFIKSKVQLSSLALILTNLHYQMPMP